MRVVVLRALGLGDLLTAVPALRGVRAAHPDAEVVLVAPTSLASLLPAGLVDDVRDRSFVPGIRSDARLDDDLAGADLAVNLHGRGPQSTALLRSVDPARLAAFGVTSTWRDDEHEVLRWCRLVTEAGMPADPRRLDIPAAPGGVPGAVVLHPGAALPSRRWPVGRWADVARGLAAAGHRVLVTGGPGERDDASAVAQRARLPERDVLAGRTSAGELAAVVAAASLVVAPDTGVAHLATAVGTPSVVLFGPTPPALWGPPPDRPRHRVLWAGRTGDNDAPHADPGLLEISAEQVLEAALSALAPRTVGG